MSMGNMRQASKWVHLGPHKVGPEQPTYFIAEIGNNHNGDFYIAKRTIEEAARCGAQAVKFQKRSIPDAFARELRERPQVKNEIAGKTYEEYRQGLEFTSDEFVRLKEVAEQNNVVLFATPFDLPSVDFLESIGVPFYKLSSFDVTNLPLLEYVAALRKPIILSTGMASVEEIDEAVAMVLAAHTDLILLHCVSIYPTPDAEANLSAMDLLAKRYHPVPVGYSGHEFDILASLVAVAKGAAVVERHLTLSRALPGPDHGTVSIEPSLYRTMVEEARRIRVLQGTGAKKIGAAERITRDKHGKSIVAAVAIPKGTTITLEMLACKSPGYGFRPRELPVLVGKRAAVDIAADAVLRAEDMEMEEVRQTNAVV